MLICLLCDFADVVKGNLAIALLLDLLVLVIFVFAVVGVVYAAFSTGKKKKSEHDKQKVPFEF